MRISNFFMLTAVVLAAATSGQAAIRPYYQDVKFPTQKVLEAQTIASPILANASYIVSASAGSGSAAVATLTSFAHQPDVARNLTITPVGVTGDVEACVIVVNGTDYINGSISESFTFLANASTAQTGNKAFKTVTSVVFPANCESGTFGATWNIGVGTKLGFKRCMANAGDLAWSLFNGAYETTRGTVASSASAVSSNTFIPNGTPDGSKNVLLYFVQNYASTCQP